MKLPCICWVKFDQTGRSGPESKSSRWEQCHLHTWSTDYGRHEDGQYPVGVVERRHGPVKSVYVEHIHLTMPPEWKALRGIESKDMATYKWLETHMKCLEDDPDPDPQDRVHCHHPQALREPNNTCPVCNQETADQYMVTEKCWAAAKFDFYDNVHVLCLGKRLGRPLVLADFTDAPINDWIHEWIKE